MNKKIEMGLGKIGLSHCMYDDKGLWLISNIPEGNPIGTLLNPSDVGVVSTLNEDFNPEQESTVCYFTFPTTESIDNMIDGLYDMREMFVRNSHNNKKSLY